MGFTNLGGLKIDFEGLGHSKRPFTLLAKDQKALISWGVDWVVGGCRGWG